jgi:8-oxo-dGTP pyrophosphatase MutT (NUDIX family)
MKDTFRQERARQGRLVGRLLHTYFLATRALTIGVRAVVFSDEGNVLLVRHRYTAGWHFPGGGVEKGETAEQALAAELGQETGLVLYHAPRLHGAFFNRAVSDRDHVLVYQCDVTGSLPASPPSAEIAELGYFDPQALPDDIDPGTRRRLDEILRGVPQTADW